jgi:uncharacterized cupredoxin-like copper-binding protein
VATPLPRPSRAPVVVIVAFFAVALTLVLIGAQRSMQRTAPVPAATPGTAAQPRDVRVIMRDYLYEPQPLLLIPGETVRLYVINAGMVDHELTLGDAAVQEAWARADAAATPPAPFATAPRPSVAADVGGLHVILPPGGQTELIYAVPVGEDLRLLCHLPGHIERGMIGYIVSSAGPSPAASSRAAPPR